jgi:hypothetical protein
VSLTGLPKLYFPTVAGALGGSVRFQARVSSALGWTVTVADQLGRTVASGQGRGSLVDWTWRAPAAGSGRFTWTIAVPGARPVTGTIGAGRPPPPPSLSLTNLATLPVVVTPGADGTGGSSTVTFTLGAPAVVTAQVLDQDGARVLSVPAAQHAAGPNEFTWSAASLPDGRYLLAVTAKAGTSSVTKTAPVTVDRTLTGLGPQPAVLSPNGDGIDDSVTFSFQLSQDVSVRLDIEQAGSVVTSPFQGELAAGTHTLGWDGTAGGAPLADGRYVAVFTVTDALGDVVIPLPVTIDTRPPTLTVIDAHALRFSLDEPATLSVLVNGATRIVIAEPKGLFTVPFQGSVASLSAQAQDAAGNLSAVVNA